MIYGRLARLTGIAAISLCASNTFAADDAPGWYTNIGIGITAPADADVSANHVSTVGAPTNFTNSFDAGFAFESRLGYDMAGVMRPEVSLGLGQADVNSSNATGEVETAKLFGNLWFDLGTTNLGTTKTLLPYLGFGIGFLNYSLKDYAVGANPRFGESDRVTAFQLGSGITMPLTSALALSLDYRYVIGGDPDLGSSAGSFDTEYNAHNLYVGLRSALGFGTPDADHDGVADANDACPSTPKNIPVGASGCPYDTDTDGVADYLDSCPGTLPNSSVDERGCVFDSDRDGVGDNVDQCPGTPNGVPVDDTGCEMDSDGDGVPDTRDRCAATPSNIAVDASGCAADADRDGVSDKLDQCADTPAGAQVMSNGCAADQRLVLRGVNFETNSAKLAPNATRILDAIADTLRESPAFSIQINGHTDSVGAAAYNRTLSQKRADSVRNYLISSGIEGSRLKATGLGETSPIASNDTSQGRALNRRVEIRVLQ
ncbi:OmpA family protein [uncultured Abyssibacter sp.]|uniref:OmpA family protein n=1 Tax=uncultured Abyssibacter sp. TaxID=2320202 RepID=UPI0032B2F3B7